MRRLLISLLFVISCQPAIAQSSDCGSPVTMHVFGQPGSNSPYVSVQSDFRNLAPVKPAFVLKVLLPAKSAPVAMEGDFRITSSQPTVALPVSRSQYWILSPGPRHAEVFERLAELNSRHDVADTLYEFYVAVPRDTPPVFNVTLPTFRSGAELLAAPPIALSQDFNVARLNLCSKLPE